MPVTKNGRAPTGIPGLDDMIEGGLERGSVAVVGGASGTGKSILATQFLYNGVTKYNELGLLITFEEKKEEIQSHMAKFGWDLAALEKKKQLFIYEYNPTEVDKFISEGGSIEDIIRKYKIQRLVLDSITSFAILHSTETEMRKAVVKLLDTLKKWGCTCILPSEAAVVSDEGEVKARFGIEYLSDALLSIYSVRMGDLREMALEVVKMRGTAHSKKLAPMKITKEGIVLYPEQPFFAKE